ncbi:hypothetical protein Fcan01_23227 [Folsomia candida]|uniref:SWIM-type domain-containing protein n=1 Tax=Folsomia candida TaxID=158441 RepID=A0A226DBB1_FOLCA|nr:hypothetical protein Fcan01_23227 [Folsomia candida]
MTEFETTILNISDTESSDEDNLPPRKKAKFKRNFLDYFKGAIYENLTIAEEILKAEGEFRFKSANQTECGMKHFYKCKVSSKCSAKLYLLLAEDGQDVIRYQTNTAHDHLQKNKTSGVQGPTRQLMVELLKNGISGPSQIQASIRDSGLPIPNRKQISNAKAYLKSIEAPRIVSLGDLEKQLSALLTEPTSQDQTILVGNIIDFEKKTFHFMLSTPRLMQVLTFGDCLHADGTYKLVWENFPVLVLGTSDKNRNFHPISIAVSTGETEQDYGNIFRILASSCGTKYEPKVLIADSAEAITNGFESVFGSNFVRVYCWYHVSAKIKDRLKQIECPETRRELKSDIDLLQLAEDKLDFDAAVHLFRQKWSGVDAVKNFVGYFIGEYIDQRCGWYEGTAPGFPSTNNGLESINGLIKRQGTLRKRLPLGEFVNCISKLLSGWSSERDPQLPDYKRFRLEPVITIAAMTDAYNWLKDTSRPSTRQKKINDTIIKFFVPAKGTRSLDEKDIANYIQLTEKKSWRKFETYRKTKEKLWVIEYDIINWMQSRCNCPMFKKQHICKHLIGLAANRKDFNISDACKNVPIGIKRRPGRPKQCKQALIVE